MYQRRSDCKRRAVYSGAYDTRGERTVIISLRLYYESKVTSEGHLAILRMKLHRFLLHVFFLKPPISPIMLVVSPPTRTSKID